MKRYIKSEIMIERYQIYDSEGRYPVDSCDDEMTAHIKARRIGGFVYDLDRTCFLRDPNGTFAHDRKVDALNEEIA